MNAFLAEPENPEEAAVIGKKGAKVAMEKFISRIESEKLGKMITGM